MRTENTLEILARIDKVIDYMHISDAERRFYNRALVIYHAYKNNSITMDEAESQLERLKYTDAKRNAIFTSIKYCSMVAGLLVTLSIGFVLGFIIGGGGC